MARDELVRSKLRLWPMPGTGPREPRTLELPETTLWPHRLRSARPVPVRRRQQRPRLDRPARRLAPGGCRSGPRRRCSTPPRSRRADAGRDGLGLRPGRQDAAGARRRDTAPPVSSRCRRTAATSRETDAARATRAACRRHRLRRRDDALHRPAAAGLRRWRPGEPERASLAADIDFVAFWPAPTDGSAAHRRLRSPDVRCRSCGQLQTLDLASGTTRAVGPSGVCVGASPAAALRRDRGRARSGRRPGRAPLG